MLALVLAVLSTLPLYPLNPTAQDTISTMNLHVTAGYNGPTAFLSPGPEVTAKYEYMVYHPFIIRGSLDYRYGNVSGPNFPEGKLHRFSLSAEVIYYRGTNKLTGYLGAGPIYATYNFSPSDNSLAIYKLENGADDIRITGAFGYRIIAGLRFSKFYSLEIGITEIKPKLLYYQRLDVNRYRETTEKFRLNDFKVSIGYLFSL